MEQGNIRKWHIALGIPVITGILVWSYLQIEPSANPRTTSPMMFEQAALSKPIGKSNPQPVVQNVRVYPAVDGLYTVNFIQLVPDRKNDQWIKQEWSFTAKTPRSGSNENILDWLSRLSKQYPQVNFTYEWWREPSRMWAIWGGLSSLLALWGIVIPSVMWFAKGGMKEFKQSNQTRHDEMETAVASTGPSAADQSRLTDMISHLEEETAGSSATSGQRAASPLTAASAGATRVLDGKPLEALSDLGKPEEEKDYKGEFYPVARAGGKKDHE